MDKDIERLFDGYRPPLSDSSVFMERLSRNLDMIEEIRRQNASERVRGRAALAIAVVAGFIAGVLFSFMLPYIGAVANMICSNLPGDAAVMALENYAPVFGWLLVGATSVIISLNAYDLTLMLMKSRCK